PILLTGPANGATLGTIKSALLTIVDANLSVRFSAPSYTVNEGGTATVTVLRGGSTAGSITVHYQTNPGSATPTAPAAGHGVRGHRRRRSRRHVPVRADHVQRRRRQSRDADGDAHRR